MSQAAQAAARHTHSTYSTRQRGDDANQSIEGKPVARETERGDAREEEPTVRTGRGENTIYVALQHMKNHVWRVGGGG